MKKIINAPEEVVNENAARSCGRLPRQAGVNPREKNHRQKRKEGPPGKVAVVTGSGSGHEPDQVFYVGKGMMDAACAGPVFAAPTADAIYDAAKAVDTGAGVLFMVKNYTGDRAQFGMAAEMCEMDGIVTKSVISDDDVAVKDSTWTAGRRGVAETILNYKITCAKAEEGATLDELVALSNRVNANVRSIGLWADLLYHPRQGLPHL